MTIGVPNQETVNECIPLLYDCEFIKTKMVRGLGVLTVKELSCPARFNPREGKWIFKDGMNPDECPLF